MTNEMRIYENGKLVEVVKRQPVATITRPRKVISYTPRSVRVANRRNRRGTNQYQIKPRNDWRQTFGASMFILFIFCVIAASTKAYFSPKPLISPIPTEVKADEVIRTLDEMDALATESALVTVEQPPKMKHFEDERAEKVWDYLFSNGSPLTDYAGVIVQKADEHDIPWTLVAAIAGKESSFGKAIPPGSHNAWGVMDWKTDEHGKKIRFVRQFSSWEEGIEYTSKMLSENYRTNMNRAIQEKYCPSVECSSKWVADVTNFQEEINND